MIKGKMNKLFAGLFILGTFVCIGFCEDARYGYGREGKIILTNGHEIKGVVQCKDNKCVIVRFKNGAMTFDKSEIKKIVYTSKKPAHEDNVYKTKEEKSRVATPYNEHVNKYAHKYNVNPALVAAVMKAESNYNPKDVSNKGAQGLMQLMPSTAKGLGVKNSFDPEENIRGGTLYLAYMLDKFGNNFEKSVAAYNAGPNAVKKYGGIPPYKETQGYVKRVKKYMNNYQSYRGVQSYKDEKTGKLYFYNP
jgi:hypothetical protein